MFSTLRRASAPRKWQSQPARRLSRSGNISATALVFHQNGEPGEVLALHRHTLPPAQGGLLTVRLLSCPIHPADVNMIQGSYGVKAQFTNDLSTAKPAAVPGNEGVGEVIDVGDDAKREGWCAGDWVIMRTPGSGTWRTHLQASADKFVRIPPRGITAHQASTVSVNPCTAFAMLRGHIGDGTKRVDVDERLQKGDYFIQNGANSAVGRAAIQLGKAWGFKSINIIRDRTSPDETQKLKRELENLGADHVFSAQEAQQQGFAERVRRAMGTSANSRIKLALNCVGGDSALALSNVLDEGAWHVTYGAMAKQPVPVLARFAIFKHQRYTGFWRTRWSELRPDEYAAAVYELSQMMRDGVFIDTPVREIQWLRETEPSTLISAVQTTLSGFQDRKNHFVFK